MKFEQAIAALRFDPVVPWWLIGALVVPQPGATPARYQLRTSLDGRWQWDLGHDVAVTLSNRISVFARDGQVVGEGRTASNDLREEIGRAHV